MSRRKQDDDEPVDAPVQEYPKVLYIGPYRQMVTVDTAEDEARWMVTHEEQMGHKPVPTAPETDPDDRPRGKR